MSLANHQIKKTICSILIIGVSTSSISGCYNQIGGGLPEANQATLKESKTVAKLDELGSDNKQGRTIPRFKVVDLADDKQVVYYQTTNEEVKLFYIVINQGIYSYQPDKTTFNDDLLSNPYELSSYMKTNLANMTQLSEAGMKLYPENKAAVLLKNMGAESAEIRWLQKSTITYKPFVQYKLSLATGELSKIAEYDYRYTPKDKDDTFINFEDDGIEEKVKITYAVSLMNQDGESTLGVSEDIYELEQESNRQFVNGSKLPTSNSGNIRIAPDYVYTNEVTKDDRELVLSMAQGATVGEKSTAEGGINNMFGLLIGSIGVTVVGILFGVIGGNRQYVQKKRLNEFNAANMEQKPVIETLNNNSINQSIEKKEGIRDELTYVNDLYTEIVQGRTDLKKVVQHLNGVTISVDFQTSLTKVSQQEILEMIKTLDKLKKIAEPFFSDLEKKTRDMDVSKWKDYMLSDELEEKVNSMPYLMIDGRDLRDWLGVYKARLEGEDSYTLKYPFDDNPFRTIGFERCKPNVLKRFFDDDLKMDNGLTIIPLPTNSALGSAANKLFQIIARKYKVKFNNVEKYVLIIRAYYDVQSKSFEATNEDVTKYNKSIQDSALNNNPKLTPGINLALGITGAVFTVAGIGGIVYASINKSNESNNTTNSNEVVAQVTGCGNYLCGPYTIVNSLATSTMIESISDGNIPVNQILDAGVPASINKYGIVADGFIERKLPFYDKDGVERYLEIAQSTQFTCNELSMLLNKNSDGLVYAVNRETSSMALVKDKNNNYCSKPQNNEEFARFTRNLTANI